MVAPNNYSMQSSRSVVLPNNSLEELMSISLAAPKEEKTSPHNVTTTSMAFRSHRKWSFEDLTQESGQVPCPYNSNHIKERTSVEI